MKPRINLVASGAFAPETVLSNADLEKMIDTTDAWILERTGISERRVAGPDVQSHDLAVEAVRNLLAPFPGFKPDLLISSTCTPGKMVPNQACEIGRRLGFNPKAGFEMNAACSGFVYALGVAKSLMESNADLYKTAVVSAGEKMTLVTDYKDRGTCILFGDAASAVLLSSEAEGHEILEVELGLDPMSGDSVSMGAPGDGFYIRQDGRALFKFAVGKMTKLLGGFLAKYGLALDGPYHVIPHHANLRMIQAAADLKKIPMERFVTNIDRFGNTSSASIGLALDEAWRAGRFHPGDYVLFLAFGGGLSWASAVVRW